jgi:uncharacterized protein with PQ loop repeat
LEEIIRNTVEYRNWGLNTATFSFFATIVFTFLQLWSIQQQKNTIRRKRSGKSVSVTLFSYAMFYCFASFLYGLFKYSIAMSLVGLLCIQYGSVLYDLFRCKGFSRNDKIVFWLFSLMGPMVCILKGSSRDIFILAVMFGGIVPFSLQAWEVKKERNFGSVDPRFVFVLLLSSIFWFIYGAANGIWVLVVFNPPVIAILAFMLFLYKYRNKAVLS